MGGEEEIQRAGTSARRYHHIAMKGIRLFRLTVAVACLLAACVLLRGYVTDDTFIHLRYAQNLLERGEFAFNPGERTYGATSPLWVGGLMVLLKLGLAPLSAAWLLGLLCGLLVLVFLDALLVELKVPAVWATAVLWLAASDAWFLRWSLSGMETPLATATLLLLLWPLAAAPVRTSRGQRYFAWGIAAGLAGLVRPEFMLLGPAALPWLLAKEKLLGGARWAGVWQMALTAATGWLLALGPWLVLTLRLFGRLVPETASAKSYGLSFSPSLVASSLARSLGQLAATQGGIWAAVLVLSLLTLVARRFAAPPAGDSPQTRTADVSPAITGWLLVGLAVTWSGLLVAGYAVKQVWVISRYLAPLAPILLLALVFLARRLQVHLPTRSPWPGLGRVVLAAGACATLLVNCWLLVAQVRPHARDFSRGVKECYLVLGEWLHEHSPPQAVVAALDVGAVGYASERRVLDLMGLVSPEVLALGRRVGFEAMVASGDWLTVAVPDYLVDRTDGDPRWNGRELHGIRFDLLRTCVISGVGLREPQPWTVALYLLQPVTAARADSLSPTSAPR